MPTSTFYRLPEEKRDRLMKAVWKEFTRVPYTEASINRIILGAKIPRGSFYQYFLDKNDLYFHLIDLIRDKFLVVFDEVMARTNGDLFALPERIFTELIGEDGKVEKRFAVGFKLLSLNVGLDVQRVFFDRATGELAPRLMSGKADLSVLRSTDPRFVECTFSLLVSALAEAIAQTLMRSSPRETELEKLRLRVEIIRSGSAKGEKE
jgi:AcrR family transcriptional regulator